MKSGRTNSSGGSSIVSGNDGDIIIIINSSSSSLKDTSCRIHSSKERIWRRSKDSGPPGKEYPGVPGGAGSPPPLASWDLFPLLSPRLSFPLTPHNLHSPHSPSPPFPQVEPGSSSLPEGF